MSRRLITTIAFVVLCLALGALPAVAGNGASGNGASGNGASGNGASGNGASGNGQDLDPGITCTPNPVKPGEEVDCTAGPFIADSTVATKADIGTDTIHATNETADSDGFVTFSFTVPNDAEDGDVINVTATGAISVTGAQGTAATTVDVEDDGALPATGGGAAVAGLATLMMGAYGLSRFSGRGLPLG